MAEGRWRVKPIEHLGDRDGTSRLKRSLGPIHLTLIGVGSIVGTGIFVLTGIGAERAGPGLILAFVIAGFVCAMAALAFAELASMIPVAGSAYTYTYATLGEMAAWIVGWCLILEYAIAASAVAASWSAYVTGWMNDAGWQIPLVLSNGWFDGGILNLPAMFIACVVTLLLVIGTRESATVNAVLVAIKLAALTLFVVFAAPYVEARNYEPFLPYGYGGVLSAASLIFFAYLGFDAISTAGEETRNPNRDLPLGIIGSLLVCTVIYMIVAAVSVGALPFERVMHSDEPLAFLVRTLGHGTAGDIIAAGAIITLPTVIMVMIYGQTRIFFAMARDGLLPPVFARVHGKRGTPHVVTLVTGAAIVVMAGVFPIEDIVELANAGTLLAFIVVSMAVLILRGTQPDRPRPFRCPAPLLVCGLAILGCLVLFTSLMSGTIIRFGVWVVIGLVVYYLYSGRRSPLRKPPEPNITP
ncbi:amino acid permease [Emcibacter sp. SYSU 3D8]|uniref:amino acid permease n=1 Tax=Emcibacter sp. SYSU 3D8 TaxID=3133969 RepID=UPI0031FE8C64